MPTWSSSPSASRAISMIRRGATTRWRYLSQQEILETVKATPRVRYHRGHGGRPYILTLCDENTNAILEAYYPGQQGGIASRRPFRLNNPRQDPHAVPARHGLRQRAGGRCLLRSGEPALGLRLGSELRTTDRQKAGRAETTCPPAFSTERNGGTALFHGLSG